MRRAPGLLGASGGLLAGIVLASGCAQRRMGEYEGRPRVATPRLAAATVYVAPTGDDANPGTFEQPFATLERARDTIRELRATRVLPAGGATVYLRGGNYVRQRSFRLEKQDSGGPGTPVVYRPYGREEVSIIGGARLRFADFAPVTDAAILERLPGESRGKVLQIDLRSRGVDDYGTLPLYGHGMYFLNRYTPHKSGPPMPELLVNGQVMTLARWPNAGYDEIKTIIASGSVVRTWESVPPAERDDPPQGFAFTTDSARLARWTTAEDPWMFGYWFWDWSDQSVQIKVIHPDRNTIESVQPSCYGLKVGQRFYVYNLIEELDSPGEWFLDRATGVLYLYPPHDDREALVQLSLCTEPLIAFDKVAHIVIRGLTLGVSRGSAAVVADGEGVLIDDCEIGPLGGGAIHITGGRGHGVTNCTIHDTGAGGIALNGGDRKTLEPAGHYAEHNRITTFSRIAKTYTAAIHLGGVGNRAVGNRISGGPHAAIIFGGNDHLIEGNEISDVCGEADDMGARPRARPTPAPVLSSSRRVRVTGSLIPRTSTTSPRNV